jgi:hypothetical protein
MREDFSVTGLQILILDPPYDHVVFSLSLGCRSFFFLFFFYLTVECQISCPYLYMS